MVCNRLQQASEFRSHAVVCIYCEEIFFFNVASMKKIMVLKNNSL